MKRGGWCRCGTGHASNTRPTIKQPRSGTPEPQGGVVTTELRSRAPHPGEESRYARLMTPAIAPTGRPRDTPCPLRLSRPCSPRPPCPRRGSSRRRRCP
ncbi:conserved hypothetical protein [Streptomyces sp. SPB78]|nr:conserved hypothetical protein [Streptomyces sp. SPB78]